MENIGLNRSFLYDFSVDYTIFGNSDIQNIHKYSIKKHGMICNNVYMYKYLFIYGKYLWRY